MPVRPSTAARPRQAMLDDLRDMMFLTYTEVLAGQLPGASPAQSGGSSRPRIIIPRPANVEVPPWQKNIAGTRTSNASDARLATYREWWPCVQRSCPACGHGAGM